MHLEEKSAFLLITITGSDKIPFQMQLNAFHELFLEQDRVLLMWSLGAEATTLGARGRHVGITHTHTLTHTPPQVRVYREARPVDPGRDQWGYLSLLRPPCVSPAGQSAHSDL